MVNYCFVAGCGRNSRIHNNLNFYSLPKEKNRQIQWLKAAGREDLLNNDQSEITGTLSSYNRICSRHFSPSHINKNRRLCIYAVPTQWLPSSNEEDTYKDPLTHADLICNSCSNALVGFRYKCVTCPDYDLCQKCEMLEVHPEHYMLRIPKPMKYNLADNLMRKWRKFFKAEHVTVGGAGGDSSSDDEPITKYAKNYDSGIDLSDDVKEKIRKEIKRVINLKYQNPEDQIKLDAIKKREERKRNADRILKYNKRMKSEEEAQRIEIEVPASEADALQVAFADVNDVKDVLAGQLKPEYSRIVPVISSEPSDSNDHLVQQMVTPMQEVASVAMDIPTSVPAMSIPTLAPTGDLSMEQPVMHVKLSDDLTQLMIEVTSNNHGNLYNYTGNN